MYRAHNKVCQFTFDKQDELRRSGGLFRNLGPQQIAIAEKYDEQTKAAQDELSAQVARQQQIQKKFAEKPYANAFATIQGTRMMVLLAGEGHLPRDSLMLGCPLRVRGKSRLSSTSLPAGWLDGCKFVTMFRFFPNAKRSLDSLLNLITRLVSDGLLFFRLILRSRAALRAEVLFLQRLAFYPERQIQPRRLRPFLPHPLVSLMQLDRCLGHRQTRHADGWYRRVSRRRRESSFGLILFGQQELGHGAV